MVPHPELPDGLPRRVRIGLAAASTACAGVFAALSLLRYHTFHNRTYDLAFYTRMAWGLVRGDGWDPIVGGHVLGLHISPVLVPLGALGLAGGTADILLVTQALAVSAAAWPLARMGMRRLGPVGAALGAAAFLLHPNLVHVATYEIHPGTLAVLPLAWALDALDRRDGRALVWACVGVLACREDLALMTGILGVLAWRADPRALRRIGLGLAIGSLLYLLTFALVLHPCFAPAQGSMQAHFGSFGDSAAEVLMSWLTDPLRLLAHLATPQRLLFLPRALLPLALLPILRPRLALPALPLLVLDMASEFPTTTDIDSHYLTPALPFLVAAALDGLALMSRSLGRPGAAVMLSIAVASGQALAGMGPLAHFDFGAFRRDATSEAAAEAVAVIPGDASVQAPDALLPHLAERPRLHRAPPPERGTDYVILDAFQRHRFAGDETLLRTTEEPLVRTWMARPDHALVAAAGPYLVLRRGGHPREGLGGRAIVGTADPASGQPIASCLAVLGARRVGPPASIELSLVARGPCPNDLAIRIGTTPRPRRVDLLFGGLLSPAHVREGDRVVSVHELPDLRDATRIYVGALRSSGARPEHGDPVSVEVPLQGR